MTVRPQQALRQSALASWLCCHREGPPSTWLPLRGVGEELNLEVCSFLLVVSSFFFLKIIGFPHFPSCSLAAKGRYPKACEGRTCSQRGKLYSLDLGTKLFPQHCTLGWHSPDSHVPKEDAGQAYRRWEETGRKCSPGLLALPWGGLHLRTSSSCCPRPGLSKQWAMHLGQCVRAGGPGSSERTRAPEAAA